LSLITSRIETPVDSGRMAAFGAQPAAGGARSAVIVLMEA
jgi:hypothetical protein